MDINIETLMKEICLPEEVREKLGINDRFLFWVSIYNLGLFRGDLVLFKVFENCDILEKRNVFG